MDTILPWLVSPLREALEKQRSHALLIHGPEGVGQFELAMALAQAWLCEGLPQDPLARPCGQCASCRLIRARSHPDLLVLVPEVVREALGWGAVADGAESGSKASKAKPSKDIKVDAVRSAVAYAQSTSSRGRAKVVVVYPAERMNNIASNSLLKTLEEPPGAARVILACGNPDALLPTIRSRCQSVNLALPAPEPASAWLAGQGVAGAPVLLAAAGGAPLEALAWSRDGVTAAAWAALPLKLVKGDATALASWPLPRAVQALQQLCHDLMLSATGASPRYFPSEALPPGIAMTALVGWSRTLLQARRHAEHPWSAGLMLESLAQEAREVLAARSPSLTI